MNLTDEQRNQVGKWIEDGLKVSEIQTRLGTEFSVTMTYMEVRFLLDDLRLKPKDKEVVVAAPSSLDAAVPSRSVGETETPDDLGPASSPPSAGGASKVALVVDVVARPGTIVSGKVTFSDGKTAEWSLDQFGRLGLAAADKAYRPSQEDLMSFQTQLQADLAKFGY